MLRDALRPVFFLALVAVLGAGAVRAELQNVEVGNGIQIAPLDEAIWYLDGAAADARRVSVRVEAPEESPVGRAYTFSCTIESQLPYNNALVTLALSDAGGKAVLGGSQEMPLAKGTTHCTFDLDPTPLAPGIYTATFTVEYTKNEPIARYTSHVRRVSAAELAARLAASSAQLAQINSDGDAKPNYTTLRVRIAKDFVESAKADLAEKRWHPAAEKIDYVSDVAAGAGAGLALGGLLPELTESAADPSLAAVSTQGGGYVAEGTPIFFFGSSATTAAGVQRLKHYGLNYAVAGVFPDAPVDTALLDTISATNLAASVELWANRQDGNVAATAEGYVDLARADVQAKAKQHIAETLPVLAQRDHLLGASVFDAPEFKFQGPEIHRRFIEEVRTQYPDRQQLNALWKAHLADFKDITMWGHYVDGRAVEKMPAHHYENMRAYKFDFQAFHASLMNDYFESVAAQARALAPALPLGITLPDSAFTKNETEHSPDRELIARGSDFTACTLTAGAVDPVYGLSFPHTDASLTLLQSMAPDKPVNVLRLNVGLDETMGATAIYDYVQTLVWNAVISGADALALGEDSAVFGHPSALEAYATAAADINRLAPIVTALQNAPTQVAILYSDSSKILDGGDPHLKSTWFAFEGCSSSGLTVRYLTERQAVEGKLQQPEILVLPETPALRGETFAQLAAFVEGGGVAARVGKPIPYDEHGRSRTSVLRNTERTIIVRGMNLPTEYLHAIDGVTQVAKLPETPRPINAYGYPLEGVRTRYVEVDGVPYLFVANLRKDAIDCHLSGDLQRGRDLIRGTEFAFPVYLEPLEPHLIRLETNDHSTTLSPIEEGKKGKRKK